jgi:hypothetical protein
MNEVRERMVPVCSALCHDLNNYVGIIDGYLYLMRQDLPPDHECLEYLDGFAHVSQRMRDRSLALENFLGKRPPPLQSTELQPLLAPLGLQLASDLPPVLAHGPSLVLVMEELLGNAREASPGCPVGVETQEREHQVVLEVSNPWSPQTDNQPERWCDPCYTTRAKGRGWGLARVHGWLLAQRASLVIEANRQGQTVVQVGLLKA